MNFKIWRDIIEYARWAPSPHNIQAWKFQLVSEQEAVLLFDPTRLLPGTDPTGRFTAAGFGVLVETMSIAAAPYNLDVDVEYLDVYLDSTKSEPTPYANLKLVARAQPEFLDRQLILDRRTSRLPYDHQPISPAVQDELSAVAAQFGHVLEFSTNPSEVEWVVGLNADTMFYDMTDPIARNEVGGWIRFSKAEAQRKADGLAAYAMLFPGWMMRLFVKSNFIFRLPIISQLSRLMYVRSMKGTRTVAWMSGAFDTPEGWHNAGRMLARLWLTMTAHGVYLHPFGSVITNVKAHARMDERFHNPNRKDPLWLLVRLGHSELPPRAHRLTVDQLLVGNGESSI
jgi:hypothetical protein